MQGACADQREAAGERSCVSDGCRRWLTVDGGGGSDRMAKRALGMPVQDAR